MRVLADAVGPALEEVLSGMGIADEVWTGLLGPATVEEHGDLALPCHRLAGTRALSEIISAPPMRRASFPPRRQKVYRGALERIVWSFLG